MEKNRDILSQNPLGSVPSWADVAQEFFGLIGDMAKETLWPTRCAVCDQPGNLLCPSCKRQLDYIDALTACPVCGSPHGVVQCCECCTTLLEPLGLEKPPYDACVSAVRLDEKALRIVRAYKDEGEQRVARVMAQILAERLPKEFAEPGTCCTYIPGSPGNVRRRGYDQALLLAQAVADGCGLELVKAFNPPDTLDQRHLTRAQRFQNMRKSLAVDGKVPEKLLVIDDVYTTGSTLFAAAEALKANGCQWVQCATFARTM